MMAASVVCRTLQYFIKQQPVSLAWPCLQTATINTTAIQHTIAKHYDPKFRKLRRFKVMKIDLPDYEEQRTKDDMTPDEIRAKMKEKGVLPPRPWMERPFYISCTGAVFEPYVPPEGDGKVSTISMQGAKQKFEFLEKKSKSMMSVRKIRSFEEDFNLHEFVEEAREIYVHAHEVMASGDKLKLRDFVTERAYPEMRRNVRNKTIRWSYKGSLDPPRVVHARCTDVMSKENIFAQITVRIHSQQTLCIWDRFGRKEYGDENIVKDVLEYVVFEKHVSNQYGRWRLHDKIIPDWIPMQEPAKRTFRKVEPVVEEEQEESKEEEEKKEENNVAVA